jgi:hypothetical protein
MFYKKTENDVNLKKQEIISVKYHTHNYVRIITLIVHWNHYLVLTPLSRQKGKKCALWFDFPAYRQKCRNDIFVQAEVYSLP